MSTKPGTRLAVLAAAGAARTRAMAENASPDALMAGIKSADDRTRGDAWQNAASCGAPAVRPLAGVMNEPDLETARAAKRALWKIVRHAGRPGAAAEKAAVASELAPLLVAGETEIRREVLWMLSEIGGDAAVDTIAALFREPQLREDARMVLERIPGKRSLGALKDAFAAAPEEFKANLAVSLRNRGVRIQGYPSQKLTPVRPTTVKSTGTV